MTVSRTTNEEVTRLACWSRNDGTAVRAASWFSSVSTSSANSAEVSTKTSVMVEGIDQVRIMIRRDVRGAILRAERACRVQKAVPRRLSLLGGKDVIDSLANELRERLRPACREHFQSLVLVLIELDLRANHGDMIPLACIQCGSGTTPRPYCPTAPMDGNERRPIDRISDGSRPCRSRARTSRARLPPVTTCSSPRGKVEVDALAVVPAGAAHTDGGGGWSWAVVPGMEARRILPLPLLPHALLGARGCLCNHGSFFLGAAEPGEPFWSLGFEGSPVPLGARVGRSGAR